MLTTHYMDEAEALCDRVAIMDHGRILQLDTPAALVRGLDAPVRISVAPQPAARDEARAARRASTTSPTTAPALVLTTRAPSAVLTRLAERDALEGLQVQGRHARGRVPRPDRREYRA